MGNPNPNAPERYCEACWRPFHSTRPRRVCWTCKKLPLGRARGARRGAGSRAPIRSMPDALALIDSQLASATGAEAMLLEITRDALICLRDQPPLAQADV